MRVVRHETETSRWEVARRLAAPALRPYLAAIPEGWEQAHGPGSQLREVPIPGIPLILNLGARWEIEDVSRTVVHDSFLAGLHTKPTLVWGGSSWACIELRLTPLGARRLLGVPMHELADQTVALDDLLPSTRELVDRLRDECSWQDRFDLVDEFLLRRLAHSVAPLAGVEWSWQELRRTHGRAPISGLAEELGWSHRRLINHFREQIGLTPKTLARVIRFDRAVRVLRSGSVRGLAELAFDCGYFDQAHLNRDFRELAGTSPTAFAASRLDSGGIAA